MGAARVGRVRPGPRALPRRAGRVPDPGRPPALRGGQGPRHRPQGAPPRRAHHGARPYRGGGAAPDRDRLPGTRRRRRLREPSAAGGPGGRRSGDGPAGRPEPGHVRCPRYHRIRPGRVDRRAPLRGGVPSRLTGRRRAARGPARRRSPGSVLRPRQLHDAAWGDRRHRRRRGQRPARAVRLPGGPATAASGPCRLRRHGVDADVDPRGGAGGDHVASRRPQARGADAGARGPRQLDRSDVATVQRDGCAPSATRTQDRPGTGRPARDPHAVARAAGAVPLRWEPAEGGRRTIVPQGADRHPGVRADAGRRRRFPLRHLRRVALADRRRGRAPGQIERPARARRSVRSGARHVPRPDHRGDPRRGAGRAPYRRGHRARARSLQGRAFSRSGWPCRRALPRKA